MQQEFDVMRLQKQIFNPVEEKASMRILRRSQGS